MKYLRSTLLILLLIICARSVSADSISLNLSPSVTNLIVKPGNSPTIRFSLENKGDPTFVTLKMVNFTSSDKYGQPNLSTNLTGLITFNSLSSDINFTEPFLLRTNQKKVISLRVQIPENTPEQDYYFTLLATTSPFPAKEGETAISFTTSVGSHLLMSVTKNGELETQAKISVFSIPVKYKLPFLNEIPIYDSSDSIPVMLIVKNSGRNVISPEGGFILKGLLTEKKYSIVPSNIISNAQRVVYINQDCQENCFQDASLTLKGIFMGKYSVSTAIHFYKGSPTIFATTSFIAFPFKFTGIVSMIVIVLYILKSKLKRS